MIGIRIKECREKLGLTQEELGESAGINKSPRQRIADMEAGRRNPSPATLRSICEAMGTTPGELTKTIPMRLQEILSREEQPTLKSENEFYYLAGMFVATLVSIYPVSKKYKMDYFEPVNICKGQKLKDRLRQDLFTNPTNRIFRVESETRNKIIAAFFGWQSDVKNAREFNSMHLYEDFSLGYFQTQAYPII